MVSSHPDFIILDKQITTISTQRWRIHRTKPQIPGISEEERQRRRESNKLSTRINFVGWILEVELPDWDSPRAILNIRYLFIATTLQLSGQLCWVDSWGGVLFCPIQTMVIHIYVWPRITHIYYICWCQEYPSYFHCFTRHKQALGVLLILAPTSQQISLRCDISEGMLHAFKLLDVCLLHAL